MKICHFIASSLFGGAERVVVNLCNQMSKEHEVHLITFDSRENLEELSSDVILHTVKEFKRYNIFAFTKLAKLINKIDPEIVNSHGAKAARIIYNIQNRLNCPFVGTKHNARRGNIFNKINHVVAVSTDAKKSVMHNNVKVIYNGIRPVQTHTQIHKEVFTILAVGRLDKIKGFDILIKECAKLNFPFRLNIVGEGSEEENLKVIIGKLQINDKVNLLGFRKDIPEQMSQADIVVMSSHSEGFSLVMVESLFYANLFISTKVSGAKEVLSEQFFIENFDIASKLTDIYEDKGKYIKVFNILKESIKEKFLLKTVTQEYVAYYQEILKVKE